MPAHLLVLLIFTTLLAAACDDAPTEDGGAGGSGGEAAGGSGGGGGGATGPVCGNGSVEAGERCDGDCPATCDDGDACTDDALTGSAATCDATCGAAPKACTAGRDGCCPAGCTTDTDVDCGSDCTNPATWPEEWVAFEEEVLRLVNIERSQGAICGGVERAASGPLHDDARLRVSARCHSADMGHRDFFDHVNLDGDDPFVRMERAGYSAPPLGENIAAGQTSAAEVVAGWMDSPGHCMNITEGGFAALGVGYANARGSAYRHYWTQNFGGQ